MFYSNYIKFSMLKYFFTNSVSILVKTLLSGQFIGTDQFANRYYASSSKKERWVLYGKISNASTIPPVWYLWIHHMTDDVLSKNTKKQWVQEHLPNMTGTNFAYTPKGHVKRGSQDIKSQYRYASWTPHS